jgi:hypothetical protein
MSPNKYVFYWHIHDLDSCRLYNLVVCLYMVRVKFISLDSFTLGVILVFYKSTYVDNMLTKTEHWTF